MLFMGQEFAASAPFLYFADHTADLAQQVRSGRRAFLGQFPSLALPDLQAEMDDPADPETYRRCALDYRERDANAEVYTMHRDLLHLRRTDPVLGSAGKGRLDGAALGGDAFVLRYFGGGGDDRLLIVNLGRDLTFSPAPEPLLAPPAGARWEVLWSSEDPDYGGSGSPSPESEDGRWWLPGEAATVLAPTIRSEVS
jgi:maltooligosyltrehalose trehalohydrolase